MCNSFDITSILSADREPEKGQLIYVLLMCVVTPFWLPLDNKVPLLSAQISLFSSYTNLLSSSFLLCLACCIIFFFVILINIPKSSPSKWIPSPSPFPSSFPSTFTSYTPGPHILPSLLSLGAAEALFPSPLSLTRWWSHMAVRMRRNDPTSLIPSPGRWPDSPALGRSASRAGTQWVLKRKSKVRAKVSSIRFCRSCKLNVTTKRNFRAETRRHTNNYLPIFCSIFFYWKCALRDLFFYQLLRK